jgi:hypothetical protein
MNIQLKNHLRSIQDKPSGRSEAFYPLAGKLFADSQQQCPQKLAFWWHQIGYVLCREDD